MSPRSRCAERIHRHERLRGLLKFTRRKNIDPTASETNGDDDSASEIEEKTKRKTALPSAKTTKEFGAYIDGFTTTRPLFQAWTP